MPGKVNPVMSEALLMVSAQIIGNDMAITLGGLGSVLELNMMMPLMAHNLLSGIEMLSNAISQFAERCLVGIEADEVRCAKSIELNLSMATALVPWIGYDKAAEISKEAYRSGATVREVAQSWEVLSPEELNQALDVRRSTEPGLPGSE